MANSRLARKLPFLSFLAALTAAGVVGAVAHVELEALAARPEGVAPETLERFR